MRRLLLIAAALTVVVYLCAPPRPLALPPVPEIAEPIRGVIHVHTRRSDGSGTREQVARAAARAGLRFVVLTDHGDASRAPQPPAYIDGVLLIDAVEVSTDQGHLLALNLERSPYPLGGEARDVVDDVRRMGGTAIAAHPDSRKPELRWTEWTVPIHGVEYLNGDSEWRDESVLTLARTFFGYPVRPAAALASLFDRSDELFERWDGLTTARPVFGLAGADAHGRIGLRAEEPYRGRLALPLPGYEAVFRSASVALPRVRIAGDATTDAAAILGELGAGRVYSSVDALAPHPRFEFTATSGDIRAEGGEALTIGGPVRLRVRVQAPRGAAIVLFRDGLRLLESPAPALDRDVEATPAVYRVEVQLPGAPGTPPVPWIVSNPIYVGRGAPAGAEPVRRSAGPTHQVYGDGPAPQWTIEHSSGSKAALDVVDAPAGSQLMFRYALSGPESSHPFAALVAPAGDQLKTFTRLVFQARSDRPMRLSVQLRASSADAEGERWHRSVFVDRELREIAVSLDDMRPRGATRTPTPRLAEVGWLLFVVDTVNTAVGTAGQLALDEIRYER